GSTDRTVEIIEKYASHYTHIRWISEKDWGQSDALNKGIAMAKGEVIGILNVDDFYEPNVLSRVLEIFEISPEPSLIVGNCKLWDDEENLLFINKPSKLKLYDLLIDRPAPANPSAYFYHTSLHQKVGFYEVDDHYTMDLDFILKAVQVARVRYVDEDWGNFRLIEGTKTSNDIKSGKAKPRRDDLLKKYRKDLSPFYLAKLILKEDLRAIKHIYVSKAKLMQSKHLENV
ncbi:MAG: glycosyltransferase, partial [Chroococcidiopsidaceae cyanobacterium CP_BM_RX_35]|nr:glycosyltransferase [Chroococcidiopsidaceae cyanobacterium CP_BM_RX_35]